MDKKRQTLLLLLLHYLPFHHCAMSVSFVSAPAPLKLKLSPPSSATLSLRSSFLPLYITNARPIKPLPSLTAKSPIITTSSLEAGVGLMGTKLGMMSYFEPSGTVVPVTVVGFREGNIVTQVKTVATDGYNAVQVGYRRVRDKKLTKPEMGHLEKSGIIPLRHLQEFRLVSVDGFESNQKLVLEELFKEGDLVDVSGTTIGKGFQGNDFVANVCTLQLLS